MRRFFFYLLTLLKEFNLIILIMNVSLTFSVMLAFLIIKSTDIGKNRCEITEVQSVEATRPLNRIHKNHACVKLISVFLRTKGISSKINIRLKKVHAKLLEIVVNIVI